MLEHYGVELIGAKLEAIKKAEDRELFKAAMAAHRPRRAAQRHRPHARGGARASRPSIGLPLIIRPSRTLGGTGGGIAATDEEFDASSRCGLAASPISEILIEESIAGWKEFELEVMRDGKDNVVIVCSIENFDPMGVHTGDSHHRGAGADADRQGVPAHARRRDRDHPRDRRRYRRLEHPVRRPSGRTGRLVVIEMNPRVSRSSALASKATGFPIAKIAAKLAVGYTLDEIRNDITRETPACFEPTIDYVVTKIPRFTFEKFPQAPDVSRTQMKSVGEAMAIGRTFKESLQKAIRSLEIDSLRLRRQGRAARAPPARRCDDKLRGRMPGACGTSPTRIRRA